MFGEIKTSLFLVVSPLPSFLPTLAIPSCAYPRYVGRPRRSLTFGGSGGIFFFDASEELERRGGRRGLGGQRGRGRIWRRMEQTLSRGVLLQIEEEDGHGEDQASGGYPLEGSDLAAVRRILEREASKQEQRWRECPNAAEPAQGGRRG